jgi:hypothetical protein
VNNNYPSASQAIRNISDIRAPFEVLMEEGKFRVLHFASPGIQGAEYWVVNEKGFLWEPADNESAALDYLMSEEAKEYNGA